MNTVISLWKFRSYLKQLPEGSTAGLRHNAMHCPLACFLLHETQRQHWVTTHFYFSAPEALDHLPLWGDLFVQLIDGEPGRSVDADAPFSSDVSCADALACLAQAEYEAAQHLLPRWSSRSRCVGIMSDGRPCEERGLYHLHAFLGDTLTGPATFYEVNGLVCETCFARIVIPPRSWWQHVEDERLLAFLGAGG
jgi:hypothetical protein